MKTVIKTTLKLQNVYSTKDYLITLYAQLADRDYGINISHKVMPKFSVHEKFVNSHPYKQWCFIMVDTELLRIIGQIYLTKHNEVGIFINEKFHQRKGYGRIALEMLMERNKGQRFLANIKPSNEQSIKFFTSLGFKHIQNTYQLEYKKDG